MIQYKYKINIEMKESWYDMKYKVINNRDGEIVVANTLKDIVEYMDEIRLTDDYITISEEEKN